MNTAQNPWKSDVNSLVKRLTDPCFQRALEHPDFNDAIIAVVQANEDSLTTMDFSEVIFITLVELITELDITFEVREGDPRLFCVSDGADDAFWRAGKWVEVDDDGNEIE